MKYGKNSILFVGLIVSLAFLTATVSADTYEVTVSSTSPIAGTPIAVEALLRNNDASVNGTSGQVVTWTANPATGTFSAATSMTDAAGIAHVNYTTASSVGTSYTITATTNLTTGTSTTITTVLGAPVSNAAPTIISITPSTGYNTSTVSITNLAGTSFNSTPMVSLIRSGSNPINASGVSATSTSIACIFDLTNKQAGLWDIIVTNPDGQSYTLANGFEVKSTSSSVTVTGITPSSSVTNKTVSITSLAGTGFTGTPTVYLKRSGYNNVAGTFTLSSATLLTGNFNLTKVVPGDYQVCVVITGSDPVCGLTFTVNSMVTAANGTLYFKSSPTGANVYVNSIHRGTTPLYLDVAPGSYIIKLQKDSYLDWADRVAVTSNNQTTVSADMTYQSSSTTAPTPTPLIITTMATPKPAITSSRTVPTPWATAAATPESPVSIPAILGGICLALIVVSRR